MNQPVLIFVFSVLLGIAVIVAAIGAWWGNPIARTAHVLFVSIHYALIAFNNVDYAITGIFSGSMAVKAWGRAFRSLFWIGINIWYFFGRRPREFYGKNP